MKVFISADIEGVAGIAAPEEANPDHRDVAYFQDQMTQEVRAACEGAIAAGAKEILVKDAHWTGRNINPRKLPECAKMVRAWTGHPFSMMAELDSSFAAALMIGYHARAGSAGNPLAHTMRGAVVAEMRMNGVPASEFLINTMTATSVGVPVTFLSGDESLCHEVKGYNDGIKTFATLKGIGTGVVAEHPEVCLRRIREGVEESLRGDLKKKVKPLPKSFEIEIDYKQPKEAYGRSFYPGAKLVGEKTVAYKTTEYFDILRMIQFCIKGLLLALFIGAVAPKGFAEEFLGEESAPSEAAAAPAPKKANQAGMKKETHRDRPESAGGDISLSGGLGASSGLISGEITVGYGLNRFAAIDTTINYLRHSGDRHEGEQYGPEVDLVLRYPNQTMVTPFVGAGPAYWQWTRDYAGETFDHDNGYTGNVFGGLNIRLTRHFGLQGVRKQTRWLTPPPKSFSDRETRESKVAFTNAIGFHVVW